MSRQIDTCMLAGQEFTLVYGDALIPYTVAIRPRDNGKVLIKVHDDGRVVAQAPLSANIVSIREAMSQRAGWVWRQLADFRKYQQDVQPRQYISGESHFYLGRRYLLKVNRRTDGVEGRSSVKLTRGRFEVNVRTDDRCGNKGEVVKRQLEQWYQAKAGDVFQRRLQALLPETPWVESLPKLRLQKMQKQWGSCSVDNVLTLNTHLVKAPRDCIDYVILHELCHVRERNHGQQFYGLLQSVMPDWEKRKADLDQHAFLFLA